MQNDGVVLRLLRLCKKLRLNVLMGIRSFCWSGQGDAAGRHFRTACSSRRAVFRCMTAVGRPHAFGKRREDRGGLGRGALGRSALGRGASDMAASMPLGSVA